MGGLRVSASTGGTAHCEQMNCLLRPCAAARPCRPAPLQPAHAARLVCPRIHELT